MSNLKQIIATAAVLAVTSSAWADNHNDAKCGKGSCAKKEHSQKEAGCGKGSCSKKEAKADAKCGKGEAKCSKGEAKCGKGEAKCSKGEHK